jgi:predicted nucleic acid-binding Zn ribbon protein
VQFGTAGTLPVQLFGVLALIAVSVVVMVPPSR